LERALKEEGEGRTPESIKKELNGFLVFWLGNLIEQGHKIVG